VEPIRSIVARFPQRELEIRRLCTRSDDFRSVCADYEEAMKALCHWQKAGGPGEQKVEEYTNFLTELEAEIVAQLNRRGSSS
jgi:hypothetical protein